MSIEFLSILFVAVFAVTLLTGLPLAFATGAVAVVFAVVLFGMPGLNLIVSRMYTLMGNYVLVSVPLFIFMACILERAGIAEAIFRAVHVWAGRLRGGLAVAVIISCALMAAMVGVIGAEIVTMGVVALPAMLAKKYKKDLALGCICAGGGLATLIPAERRLHHVRPHRRRLDRPALHGRRDPGLMLAGMYIVYIIVRCKLQPDLAPPASAEDLAMPLREKLALLKELILPAWSPSACSVRSTWAGPRRPKRPASASPARCSPRPGTASSAGPACDGAVVDTTKVTAMLYWLFFGSSALIGVYTLAGGTKLIQEAMTNLPVGPMGVILIMMLIWIILGCFIDWIGILLLTAPIFVPVASALGFDLVWLGVLFCMNMQISYVSPPFGPAAFYLKGVVPPDITLGDIFRSIMPYMVLQLIALGSSSPFRRSRSGCRARWRGSDRWSAGSTRWSTSCACRHRMTPTSRCYRSATRPLPTTSNAMCWSPAAAWAASLRRWRPHAAAAAPA
jgi:TRAP-type mannitol/chloroaromatic compound transport system permease large subunit